MPQFKNVQCLDTIIQIILWVEGEEKGFYNISLFNRENHKKEGNMFIHISEKGFVLTFTLLVKPRIPDPQLNKTLRTEVYVGMPK